MRISDWSSDVCSSDLLYFVDRKKDAIRRRGENISAYELEMIISRHPALREAAAVAVSSELGEDDVLVCLVANPDVRLDFAELISFCAANMPYFLKIGSTACMARGWSTLRITRV